MLTVDITGVTSPGDSFRFIADNDHIPSLLNEYQATITGDTPTRVEFELGGQTLTDSSSDGGWTAEFDMSALTLATDLTVRAYQGSTLSDTYTQR